MNAYIENARMKKKTKFNLKNAIRALSIEANFQNSIWIFTINSELIENPKYK